jgi:hypothetical protein
VFPPLTFTPVVPSATLTALCGHRDRGAGNWTDRLLFPRGAGEAADGCKDKKVDRIKRLPAR